MVKTILYFHGFASSSDSEKADILKNYISSFAKKTRLVVPDLNDNFQKAVKEIKELIKSNDEPIAFMGSSLGGYYAAYFSSISNSKAILINPAIPPLKDFDIHLGENENYSTGNKFKLTAVSAKVCRATKGKNNLFTECFSIHFIRDAISNRCSSLISTRHPPLVSVVMIS